MRVVYGFSYVKPSWPWWSYRRIVVRKIWRMLCIPEWWVMLEDYDVATKLAGPFKTKEAAEAAMKLMEET